jgi:anti-sigma factor RsiW
MTTRPYLPCSEIIEFLADFLEGLLPPATRDEFERHLAVCASCVAYLATYRETIKAARLCELRDDRLTSDAPDELIEAILRSTTRA